MSKKNRKKSREVAMQLLYQLEINNTLDIESGKEAIDRYREAESEEMFCNFDREYVDSIVLGIMHNIGRIDEIIESNSSNWKLSRLPRVDISILRISIYEILYKDDVPMEVAVNEAVEMAKKYSKTDSNKFINGLLGGYLKKNVN